MGEVYLALDKRLNRTVAVKTLPEHLTNKRAFQKRLEREARAISALNHPHICILYDMAKEQGITFLVMEYVEGETLQAMIDKTPIAFDRSLRFGLQICDALDHAHRHCVIHCDLKPSNIMLTAMGVKLLDFGVAKLRPLHGEISGDPEAVTATLTGSGEIAGTLQYMAPEQLEGTKLDGRADIFSFGAVLYEMLTSRRAFDGPDAASIIAAVLRAEPPLLSAVLPQRNVSALEHVIHKCLAKNPDQRWTTIADVARELQQVTPNEAILRRSGWKPVVAEGLRACPWNVPYERNPVFTGREDVIAKLHSDLTNSGAASLSQVQAICGLGGIGKTQTAVEYAYRYRADYTAVLWVGAASEHSLSTDFASLARVLSLPEPEDRNEEQLVDAVHRWLQANNGWLLIFDNADEARLLRSYLPRQHNGHVLLTSRTQILQAAGLVFVPIVLDVLSPEQARSFFLSRTGRKHADADELSAVDNLARELDYLPLALEQAAAYLLARGTRFQDYLISFNKRRLELLEQEQPATGNYSRSLATTWSLNFSDIMRVPASADLLRLTAFLAPDDVPLDLLAAGLNEVGAPLSNAVAGLEENPVVLDELLEPLKRYSLVRRHPTMQAYTIHRVTQLVVRESLSKTSQAHWAESAVAVIEHVFPNGEFGSWPACERLLSHAITCCDYAESFGVALNNVIALLNRAGVYLTERAQYGNADRVLRRALDQAQTTLGCDHPETATSLHNLGLLLNEEGRFSESEALWRRAITVREKALGPDHADIATSITGLASVCWHLGRVAECELLARRALEIREKTLGPHHPATALSLNNLAVLLHEHYRSPDAEHLHLRALEITERVFGSHHPNVALTVNNLAEVYREQGRLHDAEVLYQRALSIYEDALGAEHRNLGRPLNNLGELYRKQGRLEDAEALLLRAVAIYSNAFAPGSEHPNAALTFKNLADIYRDQGRLGAAEPLYRRALDLYERTLGPTHEETTATLKGFEELYRTQGRVGDAEELLRRSSKNDTLLFGGLEME
jgi:tetratricopeptide (TPR) repeat protein/tRNA A-37 threonylcarbamoyl transferase component Bud32